MLAFSLEYHLQSILKDKKSFGFDEALRYTAIEKATKSQLAKLYSFSNNHSLSNNEDRERIEILDKMLVFAKNWTKHDNKKKELSNKIVTNTDHKIGASTKKAIWKRSYQTST